MKTFKDLEFEKHPFAIFGRIQRRAINFENGYGISVITDDVIGYLDEDGVTLIMKQIQEL